MSSTPPPCRNAEGPAAEVRWLHPVAPVPPRPERAQDERRTREALAELELSDWRLIGDVPALHSTACHVAVGPGGTVLLESCSFAGSVTICAGGAAGDELHAIRTRLLADAAVIRDEVRAVTGRPAWVQSLVVIWSDFPEGCVLDGRCVFIHGSRVAQWLARRPLQLHGADVEDIAGGLAVLAARTRAADGGSVDEQAPDAQLVARVV